MSEDKPQGHTAETGTKRPLEDGEVGVADQDGQAAKNSKRPRMEMSTSRSAGTEEKEVMGKSERAKSQDSSAYGSEEGEVDEGSDGSDDESSDGSSDEDEDEAEEVKSSSAPHRSGWNKGISSGQVQISLSSLAPKAPSLVPATAPVTAPVTATTQSRKLPSPSPSPSPLLDTPQNPPDMLPTPSRFQRSDISLKLPPPGDRNPGESWQVRFQEWTSSLLELNPEQASRLNPEIVLEAYSDFIDRVCEIHTKKKRAAKAGAELCSQKGTLSNMLNSGLGSTSGADGKAAPSNGTTSEDHSLSGTAQARKTPPPAMPTAADWEFVLDNKPRTDKNSKSAHNETSLEGHGQEQPRPNVRSDTSPPPYHIPDGDEELDLQRRYFPNAGDVSERCILCLQHGHKALSCPTQSCKFCGAKYKHSSYACPSKRRCARCKGLGHTMENCAEKANRDADLPCAHCGEKDHLERDCDVLWRTYCPADPTSKAHSLPVFCATCGAEGHYYSDCKLSSDMLPRSRTWCQENLARYLDKNSKRGPISGSKPGNSAQQLRRPELTGRSSENIYFESDDSEGETPFLGNRVQPKQSVGRISVSSNIHFGGQGGRLSGPPSSTLPPRPQSYPDTIRSDNRQQESSRQPHQLPPRPPTGKRNGGSGNYQSVPPPQWNQSQGSAPQDHANGNGNSGRGGRRNSARGGRGGGRGNGRGGNPRSSRGGKW